ncbi:MAG TPA: hypothetical protein V6D12_13410 [Candidatus Obscuribacterales bacterium]
MEVTERLKIADLIKAIRSRLGLAQEKFAHQLGVTYLTVNRTGVWAHQSVANGIEID